MSDRGLPSAGWLRPNRKVLAGVMVTFVVGVVLGFIAGRADGDAERSSLREQARIATAKASQSRAVCVHANPPVECAWTPTDAVPCQCPNAAGAGVVVGK
jgi:hypothetical protein